MNCVLFAKMDQVFSKENKTLKKILENWKKILEKSGNFVSLEKWEPCNQDKCRSRAPFLCSWIPLSSLLIRTGELLQS